MVVPSRPSRSADAGLCSIIRYATHSRDPQRNTQINILMAGTSFLNHVLLPITIIERDKFIIYNSLHICNVRLVIIVIRSKLIVCTFFEYIIYLFHPDLLQQSKKTLYKL